MGKLICDIPGHKGEIKVVPPDCFDKVQRAVEAHLGTSGSNIAAVAPRAAAGWHITPVGADWHITPGGG